MDVYCLLMSVMIGMLLILVYWFCSEQKLLCFFSYLVCRLSCIYTWKIIVANSGNLVCFFPNFCFCLLCLTALPSTFTTMLNSSRESRYLYCISDFNDSVSKFPLLCVMSALGFWWTFRFFLTILRKFPSIHSSLKSTF